MSDWIWFVTIGGFAFVTVYAVVRGLNNSEALQTATKALASGSIRQIEDCLILHYNRLPARVRNGLNARRDELIIERSEIPK